MNWLIVAAATLLPLLPLVLSPAKAMGRGGAWKYVGAALLVGMMMIVFFSVRELTDASGGGDGAGLPQVSDADMKALQKLF